MRLETLLARLFECGKETNNLNQKVEVVSDNLDDEIEASITDVRVEANRILIIIAP